MSYNARVKKPRQAPSARFRMTSRTFTLFLEPGQAKRVHLQLDRKINPNLWGPGTGD